MFKTLLSMGATLLSDLTSTADIEHIEMMNEQDRIVQLINRPLSAGQRFPDGLCYLKTFKPQGRALALHHLGCYPTLNRLHAYRRLFTKDQRKLTRFRFDGYSDGYAHISNVRKGQTLTSWITAKANYMNHLVGTPAHALVRDAINNTSHVDALGAEYLNRYIKVFNDLQETSPYAINEPKLVTLLTRHGLNINDHAMTAHRHPANKTIENYHLSSVVKPMLNEDSTIYFCKTDGAKPTLLNAGCFNFVNPSVTVKDIFRYANSDLDRLSPCLTPIAFWHDSLHYFSPADVAEFFNTSPDCHTIIATTVYPVEATIKGPSTYPDLYTLTYEGDNLIYTPEGHCGGAYVQPIKFPFLDISVLNTQHGKYTVELIESTFAHQVWAITRKHRIPSPVRRFDFPECVLLPKIINPYLTVNERMMPRSVARPNLLYARGNRINMANAINRIRATINDTKVYMSPEQTTALANNMVYVSNLAPPTFVEQYERLGLIGVLGQLLLSPYHLVFKYPLSMIEWAIYNYATSSATLTFQIVPRPYFLSSMDKHTHLFTGEMPQLDGYSAGELIGKIITGAHEMDARPPRAENRVDNFDDLPSGGYTTPDEIKVLLKFTKLAFTTLRASIPVLRLTRYQMKMLLYTPPPVLLLIYFLGPFFKGVTSMVYRKLTTSLAALPRLILHATLNTTMQLLQRPGPFYNLRLPIADAIWKLLLEMNSTRAQDSTGYVPRPDYKSPTVEDEEEPKPEPTVEPDGVLDDEPNPKNRKSHLPPKKDCCDQHTPREGIQWNTCIGGHGYSGFSGGQCHICRGEAAQAKRHWGSESEDVDLSDVKPQTPPPTTSKGKRKAPPPKGAKAKDEHCDPGFTPAERKSRQANKVCGQCEIDLNANPNIHSMFGGCKNCPGYPITPGQAVYTSTSKKDPSEELPTAAATVIDLNLSHATSTTAIKELHNAIPEFNADKFVVLHATRAAEHKIVCFMFSSSFTHVSSRQYSPTTVLITFRRNQIPSAYPTGHLDTSVNEQVPIRNTCLFTALKVEEQISWNVLKAHYGDQICHSKVNNTGMNVRHLATLANFHNTTVHIIEEITLGLSYESSTGPRSINIFPAINPTSDAVIYYTKVKTGEKHWSATSLLPKLAKPVTRQQGSNPSRLTPTQTDFASPTGLTKKPYQLSKTRAMAYLNAIIQGEGRVRVHKLFDEKKWKARIASGKIDRQVQVTGVLGMPGSGKSKGYMDAAKRSIARDPHLKFKIATVTQQLQKEHRSKLPLDENQKHCVSTYETALLHGAPEVMLLDDVGMFPAGYVDLLLFLHPTLNYVYFTGDPCQSVHKPKSAHSPLRSITSEIDHLKRYATVYLGSSATLADQVACQLGINVRKDIKFNNVGKIYTECMYDPALQTLFPDSDNAKLSGAMTYAESQGSRFHQPYQVVISAKSFFFDDRDLYTAITRGTSDVYIHLHDLTTQQRLQRGGVLGALMHPNVSRGKIGNDNYLITKPSAGRVLDSKLLRAAINNHFVANIPPHLLSLQGVVVTPVKPWDPENEDLISYSSFKSKSARAKKVQRPNFKPTQPTPKKPVYDDSDEEARQRYAGQDDLSDDQLRGTYAGHTGLNLKDVICTVHLGLLSLAIERLTTINLCKLRRRLGVPHAAINGLLLICCLLPFSCPRKGCPPPPANPPSFSIECLEVYRPCKNQDYTQLPAGGATMPSFNSVSKTLGLLYLIVQLVTATTSLVTTYTDLLTPAVVIHHEPCNRLHVPCNRSSFDHLFLDNAEHLPFGGKQQEKAPAQLPLPCNIHVFEGTRNGNKLSQLPHLWNDVYAYPKEYSPEDKVPSAHIFKEYTPERFILDSPLYLMERVKGELRLQENREVYSDTLRLHSTQVKGELGSPMELFLRHQPTDTVTWEKTLEKRVRRTTQANKERAFVQSRHVGHALFTHLVKVFGFKSKPLNEQLMEQCREENEDVHLSKPLPTLKNNQSRSDPDWPLEKIDLFMKSQFVTKLGKINSDAKPGQVIANFRAQVILTLGPIGRYLSHSIWEQLPRNVYVHHGKTIQNLDDYIKAEWDTSKLSTESDANCFDQAMQAEFCHQETLIMRYYGIPEEYIEYYIELKRFARTFLGPLEFMRLTGEVFTLLFNTLGMMAFLALKFNLSPKLPMAFTGDDCMLNTVPTIRPEYRWFARKLRIVTVEEFTLTPSFVGWRITPAGLLKDCRLLYARTHHAIARHKFLDCASSYFLDLNVALEKYSDIAEHLSSDEASMIGEMYAIYLHASKLPLYKELRKTMADCNAFVSFGQRIPKPHFFLQGGGV